MKLEHVAFNVAMPHKVAEWYVKHLGMEIVSQKMTAPFTHFLADDSGKAMIEIYNNPPDQVPDYHALNHLVLHLAFVSDDPVKDKERLTTAGATYVEEVRGDDGTLLVMLRDPWGMPVQLCRRGKPLLRN